MTYELIRVEQNEIKDFTRDNSVSVEDIVGGLGFVIYSQEYGRGTAGHIWSPGEFEKTGINGYMEEEKTMADLRDVLSRDFIKNDIAKASKFNFYGFGNKSWDPTDDEWDTSTFNYALAPEFMRFHENQADFITSYLKMWGFTDDNLYLDLTPGIEYFGESDRLVFQPKNETYKIIPSSLDYPDWITKPDGDEE